MRAKILLKTVAACGVALVIGATAAHAQATPEQISAHDAIDNFVDTFKTALTGYQGTFSTYANRLFYLLLLISLVWSYSTHVIRGSGLSEVLADLTRQILTIGVFYAILSNATTWIPAIADYFLSAAGTATGGGRIAPAALMSQGIDAAALLWKGVGITDVIIPGGVVIYLLGSILIIAFYAYFAAQLILTMIEMFMVQSFGILMLGFGSADWTRGYAKAILTYCVSIGVKLGMLQLILYTGIAIVSSIQPPTTVEKFFGAGSVYVAAFVAILFVVALLAKTVPQSAQSLITGVALEGGHMGMMAAIARTATSPQNIATAKTAGSTAVHAAGAALQVGTKALAATGVGALPAALVQAGTSAARIANSAVRATSTAGRAAGRSAVSAMRSAGTNLRNRFGAPGGGSNGGPTRIGGSKSAHGSKPRSGGSPSAPPPKK